MERFILYHNKRHPLDMGSREITDFFGDRRISDGGSFPWNPRKRSEMLPGFSPKALQHPLLR